MTRNGDNMNLSPKHNEEILAKYSWSLSVTELPVEILAAIFLRVLERRTMPRRDQDANSTFQPNINSLYAAMLVCRTWRDVALGFPHLWRVLPSSIPRRIAALFLQRSCSVPICAYINTLDASSTQTPLYLEDPYRSRLKELCVLPTQPFWSFTVAPPLPPNLVFLELQRPISGQTTEMKLADYPMFGGCSTVLQALSINPRVIVPSDYFPALAHFRLAGPRWFPIPVRQLLRLLSNMPALETLYLSQTAIHDDCTEVASLVQLPRLCVLSFEPRVSTRAAAVLLSHLVLPRKLNFQLHRLQIHRGTLPGDVYVPPLDSDGLTTLELFENDRRLHIRVRGPTHDHGFWLHFIPGGDGFSLREELLGPLLAKLAPMLRNVTTLRVAATTFDSGFLDFVLPLALETCPSLGDLIVAAPRSGACDVVSAVAIALAHSETAESASWTTLDSLVLQLSDPDTDLLPLEEPLARRAQQRCPLPTLTISKPRTPACEQREAYSLKYLEALRQYVDSVEVTACAPWDVADDRFWKVENKWWPLYPRTELDMRDGWGLYGIVG